MFWSTLKAIFFRKFTAVLGQSRLSATSSMQEAFWKKTPTGFHFTKTVVTWIFKSWDYGFSTSNVVPGHNTKVCNLQKSSWQTCCFLGKVCQPLASMTSGLCFSLKLCFQQKCFCASTKSSGTVAMLNWMRCKFWNKQLSLGSTGHWWRNQGEAYTNREQHNQDDYVIVVFLQALVFYETSKTHLL